MSNSRPTGLLTREEAIALNMKLTDVLAAFFDYFDDALLELHEFTSMLDETERLETSLSSAQAILDSLITNMLSTAGTLRTLRFCEPNGDWTLPELKGKE